MLKKSLATVATAGVLTLGMATPALAAPNSNNQSGGAAGLVAAVVQANVQEVRVITVETGDINVALTNLLNNNRILTDFLNSNTVTVTDVVDVTIVDNVLVISVLSAPIVVLP